MGTSAALLFMWLAAGSSPPTDAGGGAATSPSPVSASAGPCRLLGVETKLGSESFVTCPRSSIRLDPGRSYELSWNPTLQQTVVVGHGLKDDTVLLISSGGDVPLVEDMTGGLVKAARAKTPDLGITAIRVRDLSQFAASGGMTLTPLDPPSSAEPIGGSILYSLPVASADAPPVVSGQ